MRRRKKFSDLFISDPFRRMKLTDLVEMYASHKDDENQLICNQIWHELERRDKEYENATSQVYE